MKVRWNIDTGFINRIPDFEFELEECEVDDLAYELLEGATIEEIIGQVDDRCHEEFLNEIKYFATNEEDIIKIIEARAEELKQIDENISG